MEVFFHGHNMLGSWLLPLRVFSGNAWNWFDGHNLSSSIDIHRFFMEQIKHELARGTFEDPLNG